MTQWLIVHISTIGLFREDAEKALVKAGFDVFRKRGEPDFDEADKSFCFIPAEYNCCWGVNIEAFAARRHLEALAELKKINPDAKMTSEWKFEDSFEWEISFDEDEPQETFDELLERPDYRD